MTWLENTTNSIDMSLSKLREIVKDREAWHAGVTKQPDTTEQLNNSNKGHKGSLEILVVARNETEQPFLLLLSSDMQGVSPVLNGAFPRGCSPLPCDLDETCPEHSNSGTILRDRHSLPQASHFAFAYWK